MSKNVMIQELKSTMSKYGIQLGESNTVVEDSIFTLDAIFEGEPNEIDINNAEYEVVDSTIVKDADTLKITSSVSPHVMEIPVDSTNNQIVTAIKEYIHTIESSGQSN